jgi:hypothetical protein
MIDHGILVDITHMSARAWRTPLRCLTVKIPTAGSP